MECAGHRYTAGDDRDEDRPHAGCGDEGTKTEHGYLVKVPVRWSDMDVYQHINHARMVTPAGRGAHPVVVLRRPATVTLRSGCVVADPVRSTRCSSGTTRGRLR